MTWMSPDSDEFFKAQLREGRNHEVKVGRALQALGHWVELPPLEIREDIHDRHRFAGQVDLFVWGRPVEVKSTTYTARGWEGFFDPAMVTTVSSWSAAWKAGSQPVAIVLSPFMVVLPAETFPEWEVRRTYDNSRNIRDQFYFAPRRLWVPLADWAASL